MGVMHRHPFTFGTECNFIHSALTHLYKTYTKHHRHFGFTFQLLSYLYIDIERFYLLLCLLGFFSQRTFQEICKGVHMQKNQAQQFKKSPDSKPKYATVFVHTCVFMFRCFCERKRVFVAVLNIHVVQSC